MAKHIRITSWGYPLPSGKIETLAFAAEIHDIGKIAINEFIINKPGRFTEAEYLMVQHHALTSNRGYRPAYSHKKALSIMEQDSAFFDPDLLEVFFKMQRGKKQ